MFKTSQLWQLGILAVLIFFSFYFALGSYTLLNNNEGLYASIAKYMLQNKAFIIPHLNCVPYIEKPPLLYWLLSLSFSICGFTAFAARFVTATSAALLCCTTLYFTYKINQLKIGITATLIFASSIGISIIARMVYFDMLLSFLIATALFAWFYWYETQKVAALRIGYAFLGLAVLTKGLVAIVLIAGTFGAFLLVEKSFREHCQRMVDWPGIILFLSIVLPWHITAIIQHKGFFWHYIISEHFLRFFNLREPHDYYHGPIYYYLPRILIYLFPWSFFTPLVFLKTHSPKLTKLLRFSWCWLLIPLLFFSLSSAKANYYMIVSMPTFTIILGTKLTTLFASKHTRYFTGAVVLFLFATAIGLALIFVEVLAKYPTIITCEKTIIATIMYGLTTGIISLIFLNQPQVATIALAGLIIPITIATTTVLKTINPEISSAQAGIYLTQNHKNNPVYLYQDFENISALAFYTNTCFKIIDSQSNDLYYGSQLHPQWFLTQQEFLHTSTKPCYIVVPNKKLEKFFQNIDPTKFPTLQKYNDLTIIHYQPRK